MKGFLLGLIAIGAGVALMVLGIWLGRMADASGSWTVRAAAAALAALLPGAIVVAGSNRFFANVTAATSLPLCAGLGLSAMLVTPRPSAVGARILIMVLAMVAMAAPVASFLGAASLFLEGRRRERVVGGLLIGVFRHATGIPIFLVLLGVGAAVSRVTGVAAFLWQTAAIVACAAALELARAWAELALPRRGAAAGSAVGERLERKLSELGAPPMEVLVTDGALGGAVECGVFWRGARPPTLIAGRSSTEALTDEQLSALVAHEISHVRRRHVEKRLVLRLITTFAFVAVLMVLLRNFGTSAASVVGLVVTATLVREFLLVWHVRSQEREADRDAARIAGASNVIGLLRALAHSGEARPPRPAVDMSIWTSHGTLEDREQRMLSLQADEEEYGNAAAPLERSR